MTDKKEPRRKIRFDRVAMIVIPILLVAVLITGLYGVIINKNKNKSADTKPTPTPAATESPDPKESATPEASEEPAEEPTPEPTVDPEKDERFFKTDSYLIVANKKHRLPEGYIPDDLAYPDVEMRYNDWTLRWDAAIALEEMFNDAGNEGIYLVMGSGYRSEEFQKTLYDGYAEESGTAYADTISSRPGYSDHQTGLATDLCGQDSDYDLSQVFEETPEGQWLAANAWKYGFIMRYPKGKEDITGYAYEPWHFRYITKEEAKKLHDAGENMTFEEFYGISGGDYAG